MCGVPPDSIVPVNNFVSFALFFAVIRRRRGKKLISETIKYELRSSSNM